MSAEESNEVHHLLRKNAMSGWLYWIGLTDKNIYGEFVWMSTGATPNYTNWDIEQPFAASSEVIEADCVHLNKDGRTWSVASCNKPYVIALF